MRSYILSSILLTIHLCFTNGFPFPNADSRANPQNSFPSSSGNDVSNHESPNDIGLQRLSVVGSGAPDRQQFINSLGLRNGLDLLMANFPGGHITGASKTDFREIPVFTGGSKNGFQDLPRNDQQLLAQGISNFLDRNDHFNRGENNVKDITNQNGNGFRQEENNIGSRNGQSIRNQNPNRQPNFQNVQANNKIQNPNTGSFTGIRVNDLHGLDADFGVNDPRMLNRGNDFGSPFDSKHFPEAPWDEFDNGPVNEISRTPNGIFNFDGSSNRFGKSLRGQDGSFVRGLRGPEFSFDGPFGGINNLEKGQGSSQTSQGAAPVGFRGNEIPFGRHAANNNEQKGAQIQFNGAQRAAFAPVHGVPFGAFGFQNFPHGQSITPNHNNQAGAGSAPLFLSNKNGGSFGNGQGGPQHIDFPSFAGGPVGSGIRRNGINHLQNANINTFGGHGIGHSANNGLVINRQNMIGNQLAAGNRNFGQPFGFQGEHNSIHKLTSGPGDDNFGLNKL